MGKFKVEADDLPRQEIEAENAEKAAWEYCYKDQIYDHLMKSQSNEYVSVRNEAGVLTEFRVDIFVNGLDLDLVKL